MHKQMVSKQKRVLNSLMNSGLLLVDSVFPVEKRTVFGLGGEDSDLVISLEWRDGGGCQWVADFTGDNLHAATVADNRIKLADSYGEAVCVDFFDLKPGKF